MVCLKEVKGWVVLDGLYEGGEGLGVLDGLSGGGEGLGGFGRSAR